METVETKLPPAATNGHAETIDPTVDQVERWYALLCDLRLDEVIEAALRPPPPLGKPESFGEALRREQEHRESALLVSLDPAVIFSELKKAGRLTEMASIMWDIPAEEARRKRLSEVRKRFGPFVGASLAPMATLLSFGSDLELDAVSATHEQTRSVPTSGA